MGQFGTNDRHAAFINVTGFGMTVSDLINLLEVVDPAFWADSTNPMEIVFLVVRCSGNSDKISKNAERRQSAARIQTQNQIRSLNAQEAQREEPQSAVFEDGALATPQGYIHRLRNCHSTGGST